jgi:uncharacterized protein YgiM (DUF1202 family)
MTKLALTFGFVFAILTCSSQSYLGWTTTQVNFRSGPGTEYDIISSLKPGSQVFISSTIAENGFYNVIDIATDKEGYLHKSYIKLGDQVVSNDAGIFSMEGKSTSQNPQLEIYNNTTLTMTLKLNNEKYFFSPQEKKTINYTSGNCNYRASAPGVTPNIGYEIFENYGVYSWEFYIVERTR